MKAVDPPQSLDPTDLEIRPLDEAATLPADWYARAEYHSFERETVFAPAWQLAGRVQNLHHRGDQMVAEVAGNPVIVVCAGDGQLRAFYNVCRHRGGPLALTDGRSNTLRCRYHGWTYELDGRLRATPELGDVKNFDPCQFGLVPLEVAVWGGLVWVRLNAGGLSLPDILAGIRERISPIDLTAKCFFQRVVYEIACNWKVYVDNFLEGYHLPHVHPGLNKILDYRAYTTETFAHYSLQFSPVADEGGVYGSGEAYYYFVYPNIMLNILPNRLQTNLVVPVSHDRCRVVFDYYFDEIESEAARAAAHRDIAFSDEVQREDIDICQRVQRGLASRAYRHGRLSVKRESGVHHFANLLRGDYRRALVTGDGAKPDGQGGGGK